MKIYIVYDIAGSSIENTYVYMDETRAAQKWIEVAREAFNQYGGGGGDPEIDYLNLLDQLEADPLNSDLWEAIYEPLNEAIEHDDGNRIMFEENVLFTESVQMPSSNIKVDYRLPESDMTVQATVIENTIEDRGDSGFKIKIDFSEYDCDVQAVLSSSGKFYLITPPKADAHKLPIWAIKVFWEIASNFGAHYENIKTLVHYKATSERAKELVDQNNVLTSSEQSL